MQISLDGDGYVWSDEAQGFKKTNDTVCIPFFLSLCQWISYYQWNEASYFQTRFSPSNVVGSQDCGVAGALYKWLLSRLGLPFKHSIWLLKNLSRITISKEEAPTLGFHIITTASSPTRFIFTNGTHSCYPLVFQFQFPFAQLGIQSRTRQKRQPPTRYTNLQTSTISHFGGKSVIYTIFTLGPLSNWILKN